MIKMKENGDINIIDFVGQITKISVENDVMEVRMVMDSTYLDPEQMGDLVYICGNKSVDITIAEHGR